MWSQTAADAVLQCERLDKAVDSVQGWRRHPSLANVLLQCLRHVAKQA